MVLGTRVVMDEELRPVETLALPLEVTVELTGTVVTYVVGTKVVADE